ncbi:putative XkdN-related protein [uncultured Caudovirales phage]|uniref:Putative XkdN-related protein n=1 Tax=uncultured Caudovirales phage TaxID=2100421 RepID=A0A2H4J883_9CAUD|nr:putative XkdN-related protein [uncultured Caudovirales phage]
MENLTAKQVEEKEAAQMTEEDIIDRIIEHDGVPEATYLIERLNIPVTLKGLSEKEITRIRKECTYTRKERGKRIKEFDDEEFNAALIEIATVIPNWNDKRLLDALKLSDGRQVIKKQLLAGETSALGDKVLELSGFDNELEEIENIKN